MGGVGREVRTRRLKAALGRRLCQVTKFTTQFAGDPIMTKVSEAIEHIGETPGMQDHDHDLIHVLNKRLDALWRYDQYIANADGRQGLQDFWREMKKQDQANVKRLKELIAAEIEQDCF
jgi:hypothetical protein